MAAAVRPERPLLGLERGSPCSFSFSISLRGGERPATEDGSRLATEVTEDTENGARQLIALAESFLSFFAVLCGPASGGQALCLPACGGSSVATPSAEGSDRYPRLVKWRRPSDRSPDGRVCCDLPACPAGRDSLRPSRTLALTTPRLTLFTRTGPVEAPTEPEARRPEEGGGTSVPARSNLRAASLFPLCATRVPTGEVRDRPVSASGAASVTFKTRTPVRARRS